MEHNERDRRASADQIYNLSDIRRNSLAVQIGRSARRLSAAFVPQLTKIEFSPTLQHYERLNIRIANICELQSAMKRYVVSNSVHFDPIQFEIVNDRDSPVLSVSLTPAEMILNEGTKRIFSLSFDEPHDNGSGTVLSRVRHPLSKMRAFDFIQRPGSDVINISSYIDNCENYYVETSTNAWLRILTFCGYLFTHMQWEFKYEDKLIAVVKPNCALFQENSIRMQWFESTSNEIREVVVAFAMTQIIREAFPSIFIMLKEHRKQ